MKTVLQKYTKVVAIIGFVAQLFILTPVVMDVLAVGPDDLSVESTMETIDAPSYDDPPYSPTNAGTIPFNRVRVHTTYCNNNPVDNAADVWINAEIPRDEYATGQHYFNAELTPNSFSAFPHVATLQYRDVDYNEITPSPNNYNYDENVAHLVWVLNQDLAPGCYNFYYTLISYPNEDDAVPFGVDIDAQFRPSISSSDFNFDTWVQGEILTVHYVTRPYFNIMPGEQDFYKGQNNSNTFNSAFISEDGSWVDPVNEVTVNDTVYHRVYVHNFTYEATTTNTVIHIDLPMDEDTSWTIPASISADSTDTVNDTLTVNMAAGEPASTMNFVDGSMIIYGDPQGTGTDYNGMSVSSCNGNTANVPCYEYNPQTGSLDVYLEDQNGCTEFIQNIIFATDFTPQQVPGILITKTVVDDQSPYDIGETVDFEIVVENTGDTVLDNILFTDQYNSGDLEFNHDAEITRMEGSTVVEGPQDLTFTSTSTSGEIVTLRHDDITTVVGDLEMGQSLRITMSFIALRPSAQTCNSATADEDDLPPVTDNDCVEIVGNTTIDVTKDVVDGSVEVNDGVVFIVRVRNTGNVPLESISFNDTFDTQYLTFNQVTGSRRPIDGTHTLNVTRSGGTITVSDLTGQLGDLGVNEYYYLRLEFTAVDNTPQTCDIATAAIPDSSDSDQACVEITNPPTLPDTSK